VWDAAKDDWVSETETIETAAELVEIYNPADILQAFMDAREGDIEPLDEEPAEGGETPPEGRPDPWTGAADWWAAGQPDVPEARDEASAAAALYDLTLDFQERSQHAESGLLEQFENASSGLLGLLRPITIVEDDDEQLSIAVGGFRGRVIPEGDSDWQDLRGPDQVVRFYDPTDVFGDLAEAIAEAYPDAAADDGVPEDEAAPDEATADDEAATSDGS
jgi:hypothetical protein